MQNARILFGMITFLSFLAVTSMAQSHPPTPRPLKTSQKPQDIATDHQQNPDSDKRGTDQSPIAVKILPTPKSKEESDKDAADKKDKATIDWRLMIFSGCLVAVGIGQIAVFLWQLILLRRSVAVATASAKAAEKSANALRAADRPYLFVTVYGFLSTSSNDKPVVDCRYTVHNFGKAPAILTDENFAVCISTDTPAGIDPSFANKIPPGSSIIGAGEDKTFSVEFKITKQETENILGGSLKAIGYGRVGYMDIFGVRHETGFCWEYRASPMSGWDFQPSTTDKVNYYT